MTDHIEVITGLLTGDVYDTNVPRKPAHPYRVVSAPEFATKGLTLDGSNAAFDDLFQVMAVAVDAAGVRTLMADTEASLHGARPTVEGWNVHIKRVASGYVTVDRDVTLTTGHPAYAVNTYRYQATPA